MRELLRAVREACSPGTWSRGVELARADAVVGESEEDGEVVLRVSTRGGLVSPQVVLYLEDEDWTCECNSAEDACAHVAASVIALRQAREQGQRLPGAGHNAPGHIAYRLSSVGERLALHRVIVSEGDEAPLEGSLAKIALGKVKGPKFMASEADLQFEKKLGTFGGGVIPRQLMAKVLDAIQGVAELTLDGKPVAVGPPKAGLAVRVESEGDGHTLVLEQDAGLDALFENGALVRQGVVSPLGEHGLAPSEFAELRRGKLFTARDVGTLVGDVLPRLRRRMAVVGDVELPGSRTLRPRLQLETTREGEALSVFPAIVYGDPAVARVDGERLTMLSNGEVPLRNVRMERGLIKRLAGLELEPGVRRELASGEAIALVGRAQQQDDLSFAGEDHRTFFVTGDLEPTLERDATGEMSLTFTSPGGERVDAATVLRAWEHEGDYAPVAAGGFGRVPAQWLAKYGHRVVGLLAAREAMSEGRAEARTWGMADLAALCQALDQPPPPGFDRLRTLVEDFDGIPQAPLPEDLRAELRAYQRQGVAWMSFLREAGLGALLADDMGLGKTLQTLCCVEGRTLVVAPTSVLHNWAAEVTKFRPGLRASLYHGPRRALDPDADLTLTTYAILRLDVDVLAQTRWDTVVLDEAQAVKNPDSQVARAAYRLQAEFRVALTGTPVENRLEDLWSQCHFLNPGLLGGRSEFHDRYTRAIGSGDTTAAQALRTRVKPFILRRLKREVAKELPPRTDVVLRCELSAAERQAYDSVRAATQKEILSKLGAGGNVMAMLEALLRLRQAACHPALLPGAEREAGSASAKVAMLIETLDGAIAGGSKALVFSQWTSLLDLVEPHLREASLDFVRLDGSTRDRGAVVDKFQADDGPPVMLISLKAGGTGLNLTAADHVFLLDPWWNPAVEDQAADRAHRIGQDKPVLVHRLVARETVEERILALQAHKRQLADAAIGDAAQASSVTRDELLALLA